MPRRLWGQYRSLIAAVALLIATPLVAFGFTICWTIPPSKTDITSELAATARLADPGFRVLTDGALNSAGDRAYFLVIADDGRRQIATLRPSDGPQPPQVIATQGLPDGPTSAQIAIGGDLLVLATASELISTHAVDVPETATIQQVPTMAKFAAITWEPATGRLLRLGERLECYDWVGGSFVLRTTLPIEGTAMAVDTNLGRICIRTGLDLRTFRWEEGAAAPVEGTALRTSKGPSARLLAFGNRYVLDHVPGESVRAYRLDPFPAAPVSASGGVYPPVHPMGGGFLHGAFTYMEFKSPTDITGPEFQARMSSYWFGATRSVASAKSVPWAFAVKDAPDGRAGRDIYQLGLDPREPRGYLYAPVWDAGDMLLTGIHFTALKAGATVKAQVYRLLESTAPAGERPFVPFWTSEPIITSVGESEVTFPGDSTLPGTTDKWAVVLHADQNGVFAQFAGDNSIFETYRLASPDGAFPARFTYPELLRTSNSIVAQIHIETRMTVTSVTATDLQPDLRPLAPFISGRDVRINIKGQFSYLRVAESTTPSAYTTYDGYGGSSINGLAATFKLASNVSGPRTLLFTAYGGTQQPITREATVTVDSLAPSVPGTPTDDGEHLIGPTLFQWEPSVDNPGGSGFSRYEYEIRGTLTGHVITGSCTAPSLRLSTPPVGRLVMRVRAQDNMKNWSAWSADSDGIEVRTLEAPVLTNVQPAYQAVRTQNPHFAYEGFSANPAVLNVWVVPFFTEPFEHNWFGAMARSYFLPQLREGLQSVSHQLVSSEGVAGAMITTEVFLDTVPPGAMAPVAESHYAPSGILPIRWRVPLDPEPSSGITGANLEVKRVQDGGVVFGATTNSSHDTTGTLVLPPDVPGGIFVATTHWRDAAGNYGPPADSEPFEINARPNPPSVVLHPAAPRSIDTVTVTGSASTDPDGDAITGYRGWFRRVMPESPARVVHGSLGPGQTVRGEEWEALSAAEDSRGAVGWEAAIRFTVGNSPPSLPAIRIVPPTPTHGEELRLEIDPVGADADGDQVVYRTEWYLRVNGGWVPQSALRNLVVVPGDLVVEAAHWRVRCSAIDNGGLESPTAEAQFVVGPQPPRPPALEMGTITRATFASGMVRFTVRWSVTSENGEPVELDLYLTSADGAESILVASHVDGSLGQFDFERSLAGADGYRLRVVAVDSRGISSVVTTPPLPMVDSGPMGWVLQ